jgi:hypothetical protein
VPVEAWRSSFSVVEASDRYGEVGSRRPFYFNPPAADADLILRPLELLKFSD